MKHAILTLMVLIGSTAKADLTLLKGMICENEKFHLVIAVEADLQAHDMATVTWTLFPRSGSAQSQKYMGYLFADDNTYTNFSSTDQGSDLAVQDLKATVQLSSRRQPVIFSQCTETKR